MGVPRSFEASLPISRESSLPLTCEARFDGDWSSATIRGNLLTWRDGQISLLAFPGPRKLQMTCSGKAYAGELHPDGKIYWDDGDVWTRIQPLESQPQPQEQQPVSQSQPGHKMQQQDQPTA